MSNDPAFEDAFRVLIENTLHGSADSAEQANRIISLRQISRRMLDEQLDSILLDMMCRMTSREASHDVNMSHQMIADRVMRYCERTGRKKPWSARADRWETLQKAKGWRDMDQGRASSDSGGHE